MKSSAPSPLCGLGSGRSAEASVGGDSNADRSGKGGTRVSSRNMFSVYGRMTALPGRRDEVITLLLDGFRAGGRCGRLATNMCPRTGLIYNPTLNFRTDLPLGRPGR